jgi:hypothetical protein
MDYFFDIDRVLKETKNKTKLNVTLKYNNKGAAIYAKNKIKKGDVVVYYLFKIFDKKTYDSPSDNEYSMKVYDKKDNINEKYIGDVDITCIPQPKRNIPFWGVFSNEPSIGDHDNVKLDTNNKSNNKTKIKVGKYFTYKLVATRDIKRGEEIMWGYGTFYERDYEVADD